MANIATANMGLMPNFSGNSTNSTMSTMPLSSNTGVVPMPNFGSMSPNFSDVQRSLQLQQPGQQYINQATKMLTPSSGISPETQSAIDMINKQRDYYAGLGQSAAQGLATQRGIAGSSTEQFGVQNAFTQTNNAALGSIQGLLRQDVQNKAALQQTGGQLLGNYGQNLNQIQGALSQTGGQLTSDEVASLRNMGLSQQALAMQGMLGQQGIDLGYANINASQNVAQQQARNQLIGSIGQMLAPSLIGRSMLGGGGGGGMGLLSGGGGGLVSGLMGQGGGGFLMGAPGSGLGNMLPAGLQSGGGGIGGYGIGGLMPSVALGAGGMLAGQSVFGNNTFSNAGGVLGGVVGSMFGPLGTAAGSFLGEGVGNSVNGTFTKGNVVSNIGHDISHAVGSPF